MDRDAGFWREALRDAPPEEKSFILDLIADEAQSIVQRAGDKAGFMDEREPGYDELPENRKAARFYAVATGKAVRFDAHLAEYLVTLDSEAKTVAMKRSSILKFSTEFKEISDVNRRDVQRWVNRLSEDGKKLATIRRGLSELRGYWAYLQNLDEAPVDAVPFDKLTVPRASKSAKADEREPFTAKEVLRLLDAAKSSGDQKLADLIQLGMWTGARIEELCVLKLDAVHKDYIQITDAKTPAGWRQVPLHSKVKPTVARLIKASEDEYLLSGLSSNKYGDRSASMSKRFGRLKTSLGFGKKHVYHSIRKTVATLLENAQVPESVAADILGHDKQTITYGLYSGGTSLAIKKREIEKLRY